MASLDHRRWHRLSFTIYVDEYMGRNPLIQVGFSLGWCIADNSLLPRRNIMVQPHCRQSITLIAERFSRI